MWHKILINHNNIETSAGKSVLVKLPNNSGYKGYCFWHPAKLIRIIGKSLSLGYSDDFEFKLVKYGNGKHNKYKIVDEKFINTDEFESIFHTINENISPKNEFETHKPEQLEITEVKIIEDLIDD